MRIGSTRDGAVATIELEGLIDTRASQEFDRHVAGLFGEGMRSAIVDLSKVDLITSAGIRVLVMMAQRMQRAGGGLVLCALSARVRGVFDVAGLLSQFRIAETRAEALQQVAALAPAQAAKAAAPLSALARAMAGLLEQQATVTLSPRQPGTPASTLATHVRRLLQSDAGGE